MNQKHGKYDKSFAETNYSFCAMVWETLGALNSKGGSSSSAKQLGCECSSYCGRAWARISCCLQRSVGQAILNRIDGREFRDPLTLSGPDSFLAPSDLIYPTSDGSRQATLLSNCLSSPIQALLPLAPPPSRSLPSPPAPPPLSAPSPLSPPSTAVLSLPASSPVRSFSSSPAVALPSPPTLVAGMVAIKADGDCCFHLAGVVGKLCVDGRREKVRAQGKMVENERVEEREGGELGFEKRGNCSKELRPSKVGQTRSLGARKLSGRDRVRGSRNSHQCDSRWPGLRISVYNTKCMPKRNCSAS